MVERAHLVAEWIWRSVRKTRSLAAFFAFLFDPTR
jgi:hypothetical protein